MTARYATWPEQRLQFLTRLLFAALGLLYFHFAPTDAEYLFDPAKIPWLMAVYAAFTGINFVHAARGRYGLGRCRFAMWVDILLVSICLSNDPYEIPPSLLAYLMVVLGNGMRYGLSLFVEALIGSFVFAGSTFAYRYWGGADGLPPAIWFLPIFAAIVGLYSYMLMQRIEYSRRQLETHSQHDALTGLLNRRGLEESANVMFRLFDRGEHYLAALFADVDDFKRINDTLGHAAGDRVLQVIAQTLRTHVRGSDLVARYGGDEFVLLLPSTRADEGRRIADKLREEVRAVAADLGLCFGITFGVTEARLPGTSLETLLDQVDHAMYSAKRTADAAPRELVNET